MSENNAGESTHAFSWFAQRQYWVLVWAIAACAIAAIVVTPFESLGHMGEAGSREIVTGQGMMALMPIAIMPVVLLASMRMVSFVKNSYLEYDLSLIHILWRRIGPISIWGPCCAACRSIGV